MPLHHTAGEKKKIIPGLPGGGKPSFAKFMIILFSKPLH